MDMQSVSNDHPEYDVSSGPASLHFHLRRIAFLSLVLVLLFFASRYNYLLFHSLAEIFSILIAFGIFVIAWNCRRILNNNYLMFLGIAYLFIGLLDLAHTFAYKGMGIFIGFDANLPTQLWVAARYLESICLCIAPYFLTRNFSHNIAFTLFALIFTALLVAIFSGTIFPVCYIDGKGLTLFKIISEYIISFILGCALLFLIRNRHEFDRNILWLVIGSIVFTIFAEMAFTFYVSVYGLSNLIGHYFKIVSFFLLYTAIIETGLINPYTLLFRKLKQSKMQKEKLIVELKQALSKVKELKGIIPICCHCRKIRDDEGFWNIVEAYIAKHTDAEFSHGICPDCYKKEMDKFVNNRAG